MCKFKTYIPLKKRMLRGFDMFNLNEEKFGIKYV